MRTYNPVSPLRLSQTSKRRVIASTANLTIGDSNTRLVTRTTKISGVDPSSSDPRRLSTRSFEQVAPGSRSDPQPISPKTNPHAPSPANGALSNPSNNASSRPPSPSTTHTPPSGATTNASNNPSHLSHTHPPSLSPTHTPLHLQAPLAPLVVVVVVGGGATRGGGVDGMMDGWMDGCLLASICEVLKVDRLWKS